MISAIVFVVAVIVSLVYFICKKGFNYLNARGYIDQYKLVFSTYTTKEPKLQKTHWRFYIFFPLLIAFGTNLAVQVNDDIVSMIGVIASILTAMLYIFLERNTDSTEKIIENRDKNETGQSIKDAKRLKNETTGLVMVEIYASVLMLLLCFTIPLLDTSHEIIFMINGTNIGVFFTKIISTIRWIISLSIYYLFYFFILNLLIVTKKFYEAI